MNSRSGYMSFAVSVAATLWVLQTAREVLTPLLIAVFVWLLLNATARAFQRGFAGIGVHSVWLSKAASSFVMVLALAVLVNLLGRSAVELQEGLPLYQIQLDRLNESLGASVGLYGGFDITGMMKEGQGAGLALTIVGSAADLLGTLVIIIVYLVFINAEFGVVETKLAALVADQNDRARIQEIAERVLRDIETYVGLKALIGLVQAVPTWAVLRYFQVDAAIFWALVVFLFSFIPTIGTLVGILFPAGMGLLQYGDLSYFFAILGALAPIQLLASNWLEPRLLGTSFNLSPLVVILGIFAAGAIWGITGAIIIVPLLAIAMIVFARIPRLRPVAIAISGNGRIEGGSTNFGGGRFRI